jgi:parallel beta-helix repeat protein
LIRYNIGLYGTGIGSSPYFEGMYADEYSENVTIEYNTVGYSTRGLFLHNGKNNIGRYNTIFNTENGLYVSRDGDGVQLNNNIVYGLTGQEVIHRNITTGTLMVNNNIYVNRYMSNPFELDWTNHYTFTNWKSTTGYDVASTFIGDALGVGESQRLIVNTTTTPKTFYINNATVKEIDGTSIPTSFTLAAFASKIVEGTNLDCILDYSDAVAPTITAFVLPETSEIFTVTPTTVTATGEATLFNITNVNVAPALDASGWSLTPTYIAATSGSLTLYLWARDAAGNISGSLSDTTVITAERIGYFTTPTSSSTSTARRAMPVTFTEDGEIQSVSVYVNNLGGGMLVGVYADNSNAPGVKIGSALQVTRPSVEGWVEVTLTAPVSVTNGQKVWLAVTTENNGLMYLAGSPGRNQSTGLWVEGLPDPFGASTNSAFNYAIYCTYLK